MTIDEVAEAMAQALALTITVREPGRITLAGRSATFVLTPFFGGWQVDVDLPGESRQQFFEEDIRMLVHRVEARLQAWVRKQEEQEKKRRR